MIPDDLINLISSYDCGLMCILHQTNKIQHKIQHRDCTYELAEYAVKYDYIDVLQYVLDNNGKLCNSDIENLFEKSIIYCSVNCVKYLYNRYKNIMDDECICEYVAYAIQEEYMSIVYYFLNETEIDVEYDECKFLQIAVQMKNKILVQYLLDLPRMNYPSCQNNEALIQAIESRNHSIVDILVQHSKIDSHEPDNEPFRVAMDVEDRWIITKLYENDWVFKTLHLDDEEQHRLYKIMT